MTSQKGISECTKMGEKYMITSTFSVDSLWSIDADMVDGAGFLNQRETLVQAETIRFFPKEI